MHIASLSGIYRLPSAAPVVRIGALPYGPSALMDSGDRKGAMGSSAGLRKW